MTNGCENCKGDCGDAGKSSRSTRRGALFIMGAGLMGLGSAVAAIPLVGALIAPGFRRYPNVWIDIGAVRDYPAGETRLAQFTLPGASPNDGETAKTAAWVRSMGGDKFMVFAVNCAHLGCPVKWFQQSRLFMCPCHGGVYYEDGSRASGPPPRGLFEYHIKIEQGRLLVDGGRMPGLQESV